MRILYLAFVELDVPNACRTHVLEVIRHMAALGHQNVVILPKPLTFVEFPEGVAVSYIYPWNFNWYGKLTFNFLAAFQMVCHFLRFRPDAVYEREMGGNPLPALLCRFFRVPLFVEINGFLLDVMVRASPGRLRVVFERYLQSLELKTATGLVVPSDHVRRRLLQEYSLEQHSCAFIPNGFNPTLFYPGDRLEARARLGLPKEAFALAFVGLLSPTYDLSSYFRLLGCLSDHFPHLVMWIVGDGPMRTPWEAETAVLGLGERVRFVGYQSEALAAEWIRAANLCLVPHTAAGLVEHGALSTKIWAYAGCARAILLHNDPKQPFPYELLPLFRLVPPEDTRAIESAVKRAIAEPRALDREGDAIASWAHQHATWSQTVSRTIHFMQERSG